MNIRDLAVKLKNIEENMHPPVAPVHTDQKPTDECGEMMPMQHAEPPKQPDNVNMNVTMSGNGIGGIRDLMDILRDLESSEGGEEVVSTAPDHDHAMQLVIGDESMEEQYANSPNPQKKGINAVTVTGDDLASKGHAHPRKVNGGENPMQEGLVRRLQGLYKEIKGAPIEESDLK